MEGYYITYCYQDDDNYASYDDKLDHGIFLDRADAEESVEELNAPIRHRWREKAATLQADLVTRQAKWDALKAVGLQEGPRPALDAYTAKHLEWEPGVGDGGYYTTEVTSIYPSRNKRTKTRRDYADRICDMEDWVCDHCGERCSAKKPGWRFTGTAWEHSHGYPIGHSTATYAPVVKDNK